MLKKAARHALIGAASLIVGCVTGVITAVITWPFWDWFENATGIESMGREGPDDWVFELLISLSVVVAFVVLEWIFRERQRRQATSR